MTDRPVGPATGQSGPARLDGAADAAARRAEARRFIRENHPDRGGDPAVFMAGLRARRPERPPRTGCADVSGYHRRTGFEIIAYWLRGQWAHRHRLREYHPHERRVQRLWRRSQKSPRVR